jgi:hypothetical protein
MIRLIQITKKLQKIKIFTKTAKRKLSESNKENSYIPTPLNLSDPQL